MEIELRYMRPGEEKEICDLVASVFHEFVGYAYPPEGVREFLSYAEPRAMRERFLSNHFTLVATDGQRIVGIIEVRDNSHVCLFFVARPEQGRGIGRRLFDCALDICRGARPDLASIDVNSSLNAVPIYERLGFVPVAPAKTVNGITFVPMVLTTAKPLPEA